MSAKCTAGVRLSRVASIDDDLAREIDDLAANAVEPNAFYESWSLRAALDCLPTDPLHLLAIRDGDGRLVGLLPLTWRPDFKRLPYRTLQSWTHVGVFLAAPLVHQGCVQATIDALVDWFAEAGDGASVVELVGIRMDGRIAAALDSALARRRDLLSRRTRWTRAMLHLDAAGDPGHMSAKQRSTLRRKERRLADEGTLHYRTMAADDDLATWVADFLALEASGWKGRAGTALAAEEAGRHYMSTICEAARARGQLHMLSLELDGRPVAMKCNFLSGSLAFTFKIAYDETYARHSPGVLLELFQMRTLRETHPQLVAVDSCTVADNTMFPNLWPGRCEIGDYAILHNTLLNRILLNQGERVHRLLRRRLASHA